MAKKGKKGKKGGDGDGGPSKKEEMAALQAQVEQLEAAAAASNELVQHLREQNEAHAANAAEMSGRLEREREQHEEELRMEETEREVRQEEADHSVAVLEQKLAQLRADTAAGQIIEEENMSLRRRVEELLTQMERESTAHAEETHRLKKEAFNLRMQLEQTFRKSLQEMDSKYHQRAFEDMSEESKNALVANSKLKEELALQSIGIESLMARYKAQEAAAKKLRLENEVLRKNQELQMEQIAVLKRAQHAAGEHSATLTKTVGELQAEKADATRRADELGDAARELRATSAQLEKSRQRAERWKARAFDLSRQLMFSIQNAPAAGGAGGAGGGGGSRPGTALTDATDASSRPGTATDVETKRAGSPSAELRAAAGLGPEASLGSRGSGGPGTAGGGSLASLDSRSSYREMLSIWNTQFSANGGGAAGGGRADVRSRARAGQTMPAGGVAGAGRDGLSTSASATLFTKDHVFGIETTTMASALSPGPVSRSRSAGALPPAVPDGGGGGGGPGSGGPGGPTPGASTRGRGFRAGAAVFGKPFGRAATKGRVKRRRDRNASRVNNDRFFVPGDH